MQNKMQPLPCVTYKNQLNRLYGIKPGSPNYALLEKKYKGKIGNTIIENIEGYKPPKYKFFGGDKQILLQTISVQQRRQRDKEDLETGREHLQAHV